MGTLRNLMSDAMQLRRFSPRTQQAYLGAVAGLAKHYQCSPDQIDPTQVQAYLLHLTRERGLSWSSCNVAVAAFRFFYFDLLGRDRTEMRIPVRQKSSKLPEILSREELGRLFACALRPNHRALLLTTYAAGLRVSEVVRLKVSDLDSQRLMIRVEQAKGQKDRYTILSPRLLEELRLYWRSCRLRLWLFPSTQASRENKLTNFSQTGFESRELRLHNPPVSAEQVVNLYSRGSSDRTVDSPDLRTEDLLPGQSSRRHQQERRHPHATTLLCHSPARGRG